jgi:predicted ester cyclase
MRSLVVCAYTLLAIPLYAVAAEVPERSELEKQNLATFYRCRELAQRESSDSEADCWAEKALNFGRPVNRADIKATLDDIRRTFPDFKSELQEVVADGDWVVQRSIASGTHRGVAQTTFNGGMLKGVAPTGKRFEMRQTHWFRYKDGKIVEHWAVRDDLTAMRQLGLIAASD